MTLRPPLPWLLLTLATALVAMFLAARSFQKVESALAAAAFAVILCVAAVQTNAPAWRRRQQPSAHAAITPREALRTNAFLIMLAFLWCGLAFFAVYLGTTVTWQHGWEYGSACILFGGAYAYFVNRLSNPDDALAQPFMIDRLVKLAGVLAILIGIGLAWLIGAGKLVTHKGDWAANHLFLAGGFSIMSICVMLIRTNIALGDTTGLSGNVRSLSAGSADSKTSPGHRAPRDG